MKHRIYLFVFGFTSAFVAAQSVGGTLSTSTVVCSGLNNGLLSLTNYSGSILRWESSANSNGPWLSMVFTSSTYNYINLQQSTYFRTVVQLPGYSETTSNSVLITCDEPSSGGSLLSNTLQCINSSVSSTLSSNTGTVLYWEYSTNNWISSNTITTSNTTIATLSSLSTTTQIRTSVKNGVCPAAFSNTLTLYPAQNSVGGTINGTQSVCAVSNAASLTLSNYTGSIQHWESASSFGGPYNIISNTTATQSFSNLSQTTWYRAVVKNANCAAATSSLFVVQVDQASIGGYISGTQTVCSNSNNVSLQLIGNTGNVIQWQSSNTNGSIWNSISNTSNLLSFQNLNSNTLFRATVQNGICPPSFSGTFTLTVSHNPTVNFAVNATCEQSAVSFSNLTTGPNMYVWDFGDGASSTIYNPVHSFSSSGTYTVKLIATSSQNCTDSVKHTLSIYPKPIAGFVSADTLCYGSSLFFTNNSSIASGTVTQFKYNFGDGSPTSSLSSVSHSFLNEGMYTVHLKVHSNFGCVDSTHKLISVFPKPFSNFSATNVCKGSPANFINSSSISNGALHSVWNFGNSFVSNNASPVYTYPMAGSYTVSLISISDHNCKDTLFKSITIHEQPSLVLNATNVCVGSLVHFSTSIQPATLSFSTNFNFGDGSVSNMSNPSHAYTLPGTFAANLTAITDSGCVSTAFKNVSIYAKPFANFNFSNVCSADSAQFINTSSISNGALTFFWQLSATHTSSLNSPKHLYSIPGNYAISLIAKSEFDCLDTLTKTLISYEAPRSEFLFSNSCDGVPVTFTNTSVINSGIISKSVWYFGDNTSSTLVNPVKEYLNKGSYSVTLISSSQNGCNDTLTKLVNIFEGPIANFSAQSVCFNDPNVFINLSILSSGSYFSQWRFGDNESSELNSPNHRYKKEGDYKVWLKVTSNNLCVDSTFRFVESFPLPKIVAHTDTFIDKGFGLFLQASGGFTYNWFPANGLNNPQISKPYANPEFSTVYVVEGTDVNGCKSVDSVRVNVQDEFRVIPYNIVTPDGNGLNDTWIVKNIETYPENSLLIFDAWNQRVYETESYANTWAGKNMRGEILPDATYYYILKFKHSAKLYSGYITLMRNGK